MKKQNKNFVKCDFCNSRAITNFQKTWIRFIIDKNGRYKKDKRFSNDDFDQPIERDNVHLCKEHLKQWSKREI